MTHSSRRSRWAWGRSHLEEEGWGEAALAQTRRGARCSSCDCAKTPGEYQKDHSYRKRRLGTIADWQAKRKGGLKKGIIGLGRRVAGGKKLNTKETDKSDPDTRGARGENLKNYAVFR